MTGRSDSSALAMDSRVFSIRGLESCWSMLAISLLLKRNPVMVFLKWPSSWPAGGSDDQIGFSLINPREGHSYCSVRLISSSGTSNPMDRIPFHRRSSPTVAPILLATPSMSRSAEALLFAPTMSCTSSPRTLRCPITSLLLAAQLKQNDLARIQLPYTRRWSEAATTLRNRKCSRYELE